MTLMRFIPFLALIASAFSLSAAEAVRLRLRPEMVINETGLGEGDRIVDEQDSVGDPLSKIGARPESAYLTGWKPWMFPAHLIVDLGPDQIASRLFLFNETGRNSIQVQTGDPADWSPARDIPLDRYREWHDVALEKPGRFIRLTFLAPTNLPEIVAYGTIADAPAAAIKPAKSTRMRPSFDQFIGTNAFIDDPIEKLTPVAGTLREYHNWGWDVENPDHRVRFNPSGAAGGNLWFFDDYYGQLHAAGITVVPCLMQSLPWETGQSDVDAKSIASGSDAADPRSYRAHAAHLFQFAARYGSRAVPDSELVIAESQPRLSGLGFIPFIENGNEPDKDWKGREALSSPFELAAQCSADFDGHLGKLGAGHGVKTADPQMKMVMSGLYRKPLMYLRAMKFWADHHRGGSFPADVINVHHYCGDGDEQQAFKTQGVSPEVGRLRERMAELVRWRDQNVPEAELWVTEFGYDTHPGSPLHAPAIGELSAETVQAAWLLRSNFLLAAAGVDRATMFMFRDVDPKNPQVFSTSGLVSEKGAWKPKPGWYFQAALKNELAGMNWAADVAVDRPGVMAMKFTGNGKTATAVWCSTSEARVEKGVQVPVSGARPRLGMFASGETECRLSDLVVEGGQVMIDVSEIPVLIVEE